jgi:hypothetical protein
MRGQRRLAPFNVRPGGGGWLAWNRLTGIPFGPFGTQSEAIDFCYKNWPWYL